MVYYIFNRHSRIHTFKVPLVQKEQPILQSYSFYKIWWKYMDVAKRTVNKINIS